MCNNISVHENPLVRAMGYFNQRRAKHRNIFLGVEHCGATGLGWGSCLLGELISHLAWPQTRLEPPLREFSITLFPFHSTTPYRYFHDKRAFCIKQWYYQVSESPSYWQLKLTIEALRSRSWSRYHHVFT